MAGREDAYIYDTSEAIQSLNYMQSKLKTAKIDFELTISSKEPPPSSLDRFDFVFCLIAGVAGTVINNNEKINNYLKSIHEDASIHDPKELLGRMLKHKGDHMDIGLGQTKFTDRAGNLPGGPHRIMWGHDIFSFDKDNPFYLLINQYGFGRGLHQAIKHLIADTCSAQGLPLPGSSWLDYSKGENERLGNRLLDYCKKANDEIERTNKGMAFNNPTFNQLFTIQMQDVLSKGLTFALVQAYILTREINDNVHRTQMHLLSTFINFYSNFFWNMFSTGLVSINWISFGSMIILTAKLYIKSNKETKKLLRVTEDIVKKNNELERRIFRTGENLITHTNFRDYLNDLLNEQNSIDDLIDSFGKDD